MTAPEYQTLDGSTVTVHHRTVCGEGEVALYCDAYDERDKCLRVRLEFDPGEASSLARGLENAARMATP